MAVRADRVPRVYETWLPRARSGTRGLVVALAATTLIAGALAGATLVTANVLSAQVPSVEFGPGKLPPLEQAIARKQSLPSAVLAADGSVIARFDPAERFRAIDPNNIPRPVVTAVTAAEDPTFFTH